MLRIGLPLTSHLPRCIRASQHMVIVTISRASFPPAWAVLSAYELSKVSLAAQLKGGGQGARVSHFTPERSLWRILAWVYTIAVNIWGLAFLLFAYVVIFPTATTEWRTCVLLNFGCSLILSWLLSDVLLSMLIACLPQGSKHTRNPLDTCCGFLADFCEPFEG